MLELTDKCPRRHLFIRKNIVWYNTRKAQMLRATPPWADLKAVRALHAQRHRMNKRAGAVLYAVDHIVPLHSPIVCGLHVINNMKIITKRENDSKANHYWPGHPCESVDMWGDEVTPFQFTLRF